MGLQWNAASVAPTSDLPVTAMLSAPLAAYLNRVTWAGFPPEEALKTPMNGFEDIGQTGRKRSTKNEWEGESRLASYCHRF